MVSPTKSSITLEILKSYFPIVHTLQDYLRTVVEPEDIRSAKFLKRDGTHPCHTLLTKSYICLNQERLVGNGRLLRILEPMLSLREAGTYLLKVYAVGITFCMQTIDQAQSRLFSRFKGRPNNIITSGYRTVGDNIAQN